MGSIGQPERATQNRIVALFRDELGYRYLGDWRDRAGNSNMEEAELTAYLQRAGTPKHPSDLARHDCLPLSSDASQTRGWAFMVDGEVTHLRPNGKLDCSDGQVLHDWCVQGLGIAWRSTWEVEDEVAAGALTTVLDDFAAPPNGIYAVFPQRKHLPLRVRLWIDFLKHTYGDSRYWTRRP